MRKIVIPQKLKKILIWLIFIIIIGSILFNTVRSFNSVHWNIGDYIKYRFMNAKNVDFKPYRNELNLLVKQTYKFVEEYPNFFEDFTGEVSYTYDGIIFIKKDLQYPKNRYFHEVTHEKWSVAAKDYSRAFSKNFKVGEGMSIWVYPNHIVFFGYEYVVYTRNKQYPTELIKEIWNSELQVVNVIKYARGWYEIQTKHP